MISGTMNFAFLVTFLLNAWSISEINSKSIKFNPGNTLRDCLNEVRIPSCRGKLHISSPRTLDGTCNNVLYTRWGAALTPLRRILPARYHDKKGLDTPRGFPGVRPIVPTPLEVSDKLFNIRSQDSGNNGMVSILHMVFGQFLDHDMSRSTNAGGCANPKCQPGSNRDFRYPCFPIRFSRLRDKGCLKFTRSFALCQYGRRRTVRQQVNILSSYIDASQVYSVEKKLLNRLRRNDGTGRMKVSRGNLLPFNIGSTDNCSQRGGCFLAGEGRVNEHVGLGGMHTIFVREHNRIARELKKINRHWRGEKIFQTTRKIIIAIFQHIVYKEYVPTLVNLKKYKGYKKTVKTSIISAFSTAAFRFGHSQVKNSWAQLDNNFDQVRPNVPLRQTFENISLHLDFGIEPTIFGLLGNKSEEVDRNFATGIGKRLFIPPTQSGIANLLARNIQRGRDHGLPGYNDYRKICKLGKAKRFDDFKKDLPSRKVRGILQKLYGNVNNYIDLFAAGISEKHMKGKLVGRTFGCIMKDQFQRLRDGDRFYYSRKGVFTKTQLQQIKKVTMAKVLCNTLKGVVSMQRNVFKVFKSGDKRHECSRLPGIDLRKWKDIKKGDEERNFSDDSDDSENVPDNFEDSDDDEDDDENNYADDDEDDDQEGDNNDNISEDSEIDDSDNNKLNNEYDVIDYIGN